MPPRIAKATILGEIRAFAAEHGRPPTQAEWESTYRHTANMCSRWGGFAAVRTEAVAGAVCDVPETPEPERSIEELVEARKAEFARLQRYDDAVKLKRVQVLKEGPIGIVHLGDPHVDDPGTNLGLIEEHTDLVRRTDGMMAANVGDSVNNWVGRLGRLYSEQTTTAAEAWTLAEWLFDRCKWLYVLGGNHDCWSGSGDPLKWIARMTKAPYQHTAVRILLEFPNGREVRINARHDFRGHSQWNPAHGSMKAAQMGWRDHLLTCGHKHVSGYGLLKCPATGLISHAIQVATYKTSDRYAVELGLPDQNISPAVVTVIDPEAKHERDLVTVLWSPGNAAEYLTWLRTKRGRQKGAAKGRRKRK